MKKNQKKKLLFCSDARNEWVPKNIGTFGLGQEIVRAKKEEKELAVLLSEILRFKSFEMDRDWMSANRLTVKYREGVDLFLEFSAKNADNPDLVHCPCLKCGNMEHMKIDQIREHLFKNAPVDVSADEVLHPAYE
ncbi:hypothetical protein G4B88_014280 [Cannabis sativa]|uniref:Transposase-associated domain-containing protein n=1 Tax=Cannabis sativa TaxID=3483 RepID=A0A7J6I8A2_CANSA|nr:hypothetical protein G4B88_014280 [Cannabis sativa]